MKKKTKTKDDAEKSRERRDRKLESAGLVTCCWLDG